MKRILKKPFETPLIFITYAIIFSMLVYFIYQNNQWGTGFCALLLVILSFFKESEFLEFFGVKVKRNIPQIVPPHVKKVNEKEEEIEFIELLKNMKKISKEYRENITKILKSTEKNCIEKVSRQMGLEPEKLMFDTRIEDYYFDAIYQTKTEYYFFEVKTSFPSFTAVTLPVHFKMVIEKFKKLFKDKHIKMILIPLDIYSALGDKELAKANKRILERLKEKSKLLIDEGYLIIYNLMTYSKDEIANLIKVEVKK